MIPGMEALLDGRLREIAEWFRPDVEQGRAAIEGFDHRDPATLWNTILGGIHRGLDRLSELQKKQGSSDEFVSSFVKPEKLQAEELVVPISVGFALQNL
ncbi:MAG TPA: hypothetical protein VHF22_05035, partial [Planctomycetota bacterium]|nr:hypothetical protein [Planctomycetota bacterium]